jgi:hypothetical protein
MVHFSVDEPHYNGNAMALPSRPPDSFPAKPSPAAPTEKKLHRRLVRRGAVSEGMLAWKR